MGAGVECGQSVFCWSSWARPWFRRFPGGLAFGPLMIWR